jgi:Mrp family chromosome partitioning ATPase
MRALLRKLRADFDLVLVDSPPVLVVSDTKVLGRICDKVAFIVQWEKTPRDAAQNSVYALRQFGADLVGVVFSRLDQRRASSYGYGDAGYYYNRYSRYYVN